MLPASETVLGDAGGEWELFATEELEERALGEVCGSVDASHLSRPWQWELRRKHYEEDVAFRCERVWGNVWGQGTTCYVHQLATRALQHLDVRMRAANASPHTLQFLLNMRVGSATRRHVPGDSPCSTFSAICIAPLPHSQLSSTCIPKPPACAPIPDCRKRNEEARAAGQPMQYIFRHLYRPDKGMFCSVPESMAKPSGKYAQVRRGLLSVYTM